ncbi:hypothetical protein AB6A40_001227 [Gnathostoma spinigerum]|uniref:Major sperm protein n=1 Tax=Gnathostoma spinigerum TaxID=75299 RepID=A0ABD6ECH9_9BILA
MAFDVKMLRSQLNSLVTREKHMSARGLKYLEKQTGIDRHMLAVAISAFLVCFLIMADRDAARFIANAILTAVPIMLTYIYPLERPRVSHLIIYWSVFAVITLCDPSFEGIRGYYVVKIVLLALLFLRPFNGADWIEQQLPSEYGLDAINSKDVHQRRLYESPVSSNKAAGKGGNAVGTDVSDPDDVLEMSLTMKVGRSPTISGPDSNQRKGAKKKSSDTNKKPSGMVSCDSTQITDSCRTITALSEAPSDLSFEPSGTLFFTHEINDSSASEVLKITNNSEKGIIFDSKDNARVPLLSVIPKRGIIKPHESILLHVKRTNYACDPPTLEKDWLTFNYSYCKPDTKSFEKSLIYEGKVRRQATVYIRFKPH